MNDLLLLTGLGVASALAPCPMATNLAALGYISRRVGDGRRTFLCAALYAIGRAVAYAALGALLGAGAVGMPALSYALQEGMPYLLGPLLLIAGLVLLEVLTLPRGLHLSGPKRGSVDAMLRNGGVWGALPLGALFALALCPPTAALLFGAAVPLAAGSCLPVAGGLALFGLGSALPVVAVAIGLSLGAGRCGSLLSFLPTLQRGITLITGAGLLLWGAWLCINTYILS